MLTILLAILTADLHVGSGHPHGTIAAAVAASSAGDDVIVHSGYYRDAFRVGHPLTIRAAGDGPATIDVDGQNLDGTDVPRAAIELKPEAAGTRLIGLTIELATNRGGNAAGIRLIGTPRVRVEDCTIHGCDNGLFMSGDTASVECVRCIIQGNGSNTQAHNVYLSSGAEAMFLDCTIATTKAGQNVKSRLRRLTLVGCRIGDSYSRELDLVDGTTTGRDTLVILSHCEILKRDGRNLPPGDPGRVGNRGVIHFGRDSQFQDRTTRGELWLLGCRVETVHADPVVVLSTDGTRVVMVSCDVANPGPEKPGEKDLIQQVLQVRAGSVVGRVETRECRFTERFRILAERP